MQYTQYGKAGDRVSRLGFGLMRLPMVGEHVDMELSTALIKRAVELGVNYLDSAEGYCNSESQVAFGKGIKGLRDSVWVSTKNAYKGDSGDEWQKRLDTSLERIDVDTIDYYHSHGLGWDQYKVMLAKNGPMERFRKAKEEGVIRHMCFSCHDSPENMIKLIDTGDFDGLLCQYNLLDRNHEEAIAHAHKKGMGVVIMGPVGGGRLVPPSDHIQSMVKDSKSTPEVAMRFVLSNPNVTIGLSGMNSLTMVDENAATASREEPLTAAERQSVLDALAETKNLSELYCTGCGYCMPCPNGVDIPGNFSAMNHHKVWGLTGYARNMYKNLGAKKKEGEDAPVETWAKACIECEECEPKCPQNIPIIDQLKETRTALGED